MNMKKLLMLIAFCMSFFSAIAQQIARVERIDMESSHFKHKRPVLIYTPFCYDTETTTHYDVVYVFDCQQRSNFDLVTSLLHYQMQQMDENLRGFIVVGICSPTIIENGDVVYARNNDYTPMPQKDMGKGLFQGRYHGNSEDLKAFLKDELMPYINSHYRTSGHTLGIGHSLSASFVLDCVVNGELFDDVIAMSPNLCYDDNRLANDFLKYDFTRSGEPRFVYITMADEPENPSFNKSRDWGKAWYGVQDYINNGVKPASDNLKIMTATYPNVEHDKTQLYSLPPAFGAYLSFRGECDATPRGTSYPFHIEIEGNDIVGDVYITGNQKALGDWQPNVIKMKENGEHSRAIDLKLQLPAVFKFTAGNWDNQYFPLNGNMGNLRITTASQDTVKYSTNMIMAEP